MSILSETRLRELMAKEPAQRLVVTPLLDPAQIEGSSIDLRLGTEFLTVQRTGAIVLDAGARWLATDEQEDPGLEKELRRTESRKIVAIGSSYALHPDQFVLGSTLEYVRIPRGYHAILEGRSSWARQGLVVRSVTNIAPGFAGVLTLVMVNQGEIPIRLYPGLRIAQIMVAPITTAGEADGHLNYTDTRDAKYVMPTGPAFGRLDRDRDWPIIRQYHRERAARRSGDSTR